MEKDERQTVTIEEAARILGVSRRLAYDSAQRGDIPTIRLGRRLLVPLSRLQALVNDGA